mgnify:CR=1 FL=1
MKKIIIYLYNLFYILLKPRKPKINFIWDEELVKYSLLNKKSLIRFGDGEYRIMYSNKGIEYQTFSKELQIDLNKIFSQYDESSYLICIPPFFVKDIKWFMKNDKKYLSCFSKPRYHFLSKQKKNMKYGDAFLFRKGNEQTFNKLWTNQNKILLIHNDEKRKDIFEKKYNKKIEFIKTPSRDSYKECDEIIKKVLAINNINDYIVLVSAGPAAKVIAYELSKRGIWTVDTGHCFDDPLV